MTVPHALRQTGRWFAASRPGFLLVTAVAALVGIAQSQACGCGWDPQAAAATLGLILVAHAAANLFNDYGDAVGGSDALNTERLSPFSGGSRVIQNGQFSAPQVRDAALALGGVVVAGGLLLAARVGPGLLAVGAAGLALGWAYSSPRVALMSRGLGELAVGAGWWLIVVGADYAQRHAFSAMAAVSGVSIAAMVAAILWAAEFPDARADAAVGKRTLVVRAGPALAAAGYGSLVLCAHLWVAAWWWVDWLPSTAWWALGSAPVSALAAALLWRHRHQVARLRPVMRLSIAAALLHGGLLTAAFVAVARLR
jgi:1,4-dihydroxy-2-naphthoate octaprenyltransferase